MISFYQRLIKDCNSVNQLNRVHIALENKMSPLQFAILYEQRRTLSDAQQYSVKWLATLQEMYSKSEKNLPEPFLIRRLNSHLLLYTSSLGRKQKKTLIISFTGKAQRMMMPIPVFLQHFDSMKVDIVIVRYPKGSSYRSGLKNIGNGFENTIEKISNDVSTFEYNRIISIGTSGGAVPAIMAALSHGYSASIAVGANSPTDQRWYKVLSQSVGHLAQDYWEKLTTKPKLVFLYGENSLKDRDAASGWADILVADTTKTISVKEANHNAFQPLLMRKQLTPLFMEELLRG